MYEKDNAIMTNQLPLEAEGGKTNRGFKLATSELPLAV